MARFALLAVGLLCAAAAPARAQGLDARAACEPDVWRLCASYIPNVGAITGCLKTQKPNLSPACRIVMDGGHAAPGRRRSAEAR